MVSFILISLIALILLLLGALVYFSNRKDRTNKLFFGLVFWGLIWVLANFLENEPITHFWNSLFLKIDFASAALLVYYFLLFCLNFQKPRSDVNKLRERLILIPSLFIAFLSFSNAIVTNVVIQKNGLSFQKGEFFLFYVIYLLSYLGIGAFDLVLKHQRTTNRIRKTQIFYILLGLSLPAITASTINLFFQSFIPVDIFRIGAYSFLFFILFATIAILKHHLFNVKVIATELITVLLLILLFINIFSYSTSGDLILRIVIFISAIILGIYLIKSVLSEVETREESQKLARQLKKANRELKKLDKTKSEFVSIASHQLRTPLSAIKGYAAMLLDEAKNPEEKEALHKIYVSNERLIKLVNDLLNLSRIERGKLEFNFQQVQLSDILASVVNEMQMLAERRNLKLIYRKSDLPLLKLDVSKIRQVFLNIIDNAIKYTPKGRVEVKTSQDKDNVVVVIKDTGIGMNQTDIQNLYQKFQRGKTSFQINPSGTGIGLYIAHKIIQAHGGRIWAESAGLHKGTSFYISLPLPTD